MGKWTTILVAAAGFAAGWIVGRSGVDSRFDGPVESSPGEESKAADKGGAPAAGSLFQKDGGFWHQRRTVESNKHRETLERLTSLPYVTGSQPPAERVGVTLYDTARAFNGLNLYSSAHRPQAFLMDMKGRVLHKWEYERNSVWPRLAEADRNKARRYFRRLHLFENGDLLAVYEYTGIIKLDANSNLLWAHQGWNHHDLDVDERGRVYVLGRDSDENGRYNLEIGDAPATPRLVAGRRIFDENITVLNPRGEVIDKISIIECIENSRYASLLDMAMYRPGAEPLDLLHPNTVEVFDGSLEQYSRLYKKGNILTSFRNVSTVAIIDAKQKKLVWALSNAWKCQHDPTLLDSGRMLVFDNYSGGLRAGGTALKSRVVEFDPMTQEIFWEFEGTSKAPFFSSLMGTNHRLPNGNTLISESDYGRVFEVTPDKTIVWEFNNPHTSGENNEFVAAVPDLIRIPPDFPVAGFVASRDGP